MVAEAFPAERAVWSDSVVVDEESGSLIAEWAETGGARAGFDNWIT